MKIKTLIGVATLGAGHSLILGSLANQAHLGVNNDIAKFGLLNLASQEAIDEMKLAYENLGDSEGYIHPIYRGLSETIVRKAWDPIDFSESGVLKASMPLIIGQTVFTNHASYIGNEVGSVKDAFWEKGYEVNGFKIPAGFNLHMKIDAKSNPKLARGIEMDPPSVHSNSVTVNFAWQQSHPKMDYHEFRNKVGTIGSDGKLIRRVVTEINNYFETSLVSHGADPFAQKVGTDGKIVNPKLAHQRDSFSEEIGKSDNFFFFSFKEKESFSATDTTALREETIPATDNNNENNTDMKLNKKLALALAALIGYSFSEAQASLSDEQFEADVDSADLLAKLGEKTDDLSALVTSAANSAALQEQVNNLTTEVATLTSEKTNWTAEKSTLDTFKATLLSEALSFHTLLNNNSADANIKATLEAADIKTLQAFHTTFKGQVENAFPTTCQDCGGTSVSRASAKADDEGDKGTKSFSHEDVRQRILDKRN